MKKTPIKRVFKHNNRTIPDPDPNLTPEQVRGILASTDPSLASAVLQGPTYDGGKQVYTLTTAVGTKG